MGKFIKKYIDTNIFKLSLIFSFIYILLFNTPVFLYKFDRYGATLFKAFLELSKDFLYIYFFTSVIFLGLAIHRTLFSLGSLFLFFTGAAAAYYLYFFKISPTPEVINSIFVCEVGEAYSMVGGKLIFWVCFSMFVCIYSLKYFGPAEGKSFITKIISAFCLLVSINNVISPQYKVLSSYFPLQYLHNSYVNFFTPAENKKKNIAKEYSFKDSSDEDLIFVLVIGESARYDRFEINGYERPTNPLLKNIPGIFSFKARSCSNSTYISVPCLLSMRGEKEFVSAKKETGLPSVFKEMGFDTEWVGTQSLMKYFKSFSDRTVYDELDFVTLPGGSALFKMNDLDEVLLPYVEKSIGESTGKKKFLVIHTSGSHWNYKARYSESFQKFNPGCEASEKSDPTVCSLEGLANNYDNSILYTDFFLDRVINLLKDKNAFLIYLADHGESLGENGRFCHGGEPVPEQFEIPFIVWASKKFNEKRPAVAEALAKIRGKEISHDYLFHSALDCIGVESSAIDKNLSICSPKI